MKKQVGTVSIIAAGFVVFTALIIPLQLPDDGFYESSLVLKTSLLILTLLLFVLMTIVHSMNRQEKEIIDLQRTLEAEKKQSHSIQVQFEDAILKRTYELQTANGALNREIAERTQAEEEVRSLQKQLSLILDCAGEGILGLDNHGKVIFINQAAALMLGWETEELLGRTHHDLIHHTHADGTPHPVENCPIYMAYRDGLVHYKTGDVFWCQNGTSFPVEYVSTPITDSGMLTGAVVVFRDMNTYK